MNAFWVTKKTSWHLVMGFAIGFNHQSYADAYYIGPILVIKYNSVNPYITPTNAMTGVAIKL